MKAKGSLAALLAAAGLAAAVPASAQFVQFARCRAALPCSQPFGLQYNPDPLVAGAWAQGTPTSAVSAHIELKSKPEVELDKPESLPLSGDVVDGAVRAFLRKYPAPKRAKETERPPEPPKP